ncbi:MAG: thermonuclease family protein [Patescibacteria group bacterium]
MVNVFASLFLISILGFSIGLFSPSTISKILRRQLSRKQATAIFGGLAVFFFIMVGVFAPPTVPKQEAAVKDAQTAPSVLPVESTTTSSISEAHSNEVPAEALSPSFLVTHVVDGDTFDVNMNGKTERIRMIGVDTPETVDPRKPVQCFGKEASDKMKSLITNQKVILEADPSQGERDKYDRLLRYAFLSDGRNIGLYLIQEGYAHEYTYNTPYKYKQVFKDAENSAREFKKGLWADNACSDATDSPTVQSEPLMPSSVSSSSSSSKPSSATSDGPAVKKSKSNICHLKGTTYYFQTKEYTAYDTIQACLDSGGRMPK